MSRIDWEAIANGYTLPASAMNALWIKSGETGITPEKKEEKQPIAEPPAADPLGEPKWQDVVDVVLEELGSVLTPKSIIHNRKTGETIVIWRDRKKTVVKPRPGTENSPYFAFVSALAKKVYGSNSKVNRIVDKTFEPTKRKKKESTEDIIESMGDEG